MIAELAAFYRARLDDDEAYARNAFADHNEAEADWNELWSGVVQIGPHEDLIHTNDSQVTRHIARHDPARVLGDVEVHRALLDDLLAEKHDETCRDNVGGDTWNCGRDANIERRLRILLQPFRDHPDYPLPVFTPTVADGSMVVGPAIGSYALTDGPDDDERRTP